MTSYAQTAVDEVFAEFGHAAIYTAPGGAAVPFTVMLSLQDPGSAPPVFGQIAIEIRKSEISAPVQNGVVVFDARTVTIMNRPMLDDEEGLVWKMLAG